MLVYDGQILRVVTAQLLLREIELAELANDGLKVQLCFPKEPLLLDISRHAVTLDHVEVCLVLLVVHVGLNLHLLIDHLFLLRGLSEGSRKATNIKRILNRIFLLDQVDRFARGILQDDISCELVELFLLKHCLVVMLNLFFVGVELVAEVLEDLLLLQLELDLLR